MAKVYRVSGKFRDRKGVWRSFNIEVIAVNERDALERVYSRLGGNHKVPRSMIEISGVEEVSPEGVSDRFIKQLISMDKIVVW